ncbi:MAG: hypothetical protein WAU68_16815 [Vitreimonas sp.]
MRRTAFALLFLLAACSGGHPVGNQLTPTDAATSLITRGPLIMTVIPPAHASQDGEDPLILMTLRKADGRVMSFEEGNHAPEQVMAQSAGGPLAQVMGLPDAATPTLYSVRAEGAQGAPFICGPDGPVSIGYYAASNGDVTIVGLRQNISFEPRDDGTMSPLPFSPDFVCARLHFHRG